MAGYKIKSQKSVAFLYTNNKISKKENSKITPSIIASVRMKYLEINLTKGDLYAENFKALMKEISREK